MIQDFLISPKFQEGVGIATKNIKKGEELLYDYLVFANFDVNRL